MPRYRHRVSGRVVRYAEPSERLDSFPDTWERLDEDDQDEQGTGPADAAAKAAEAAADAAQHAADAAQQSTESNANDNGDGQGSGEPSTLEQVEAAAGDNGPSTDTGRVPEPVEQPAQVAPERPSKSASRKAWADYALAAGHTEDELADLTKAQIVALVDRTPASGS